MHVSRLARAQGLFLGALVTLAASAAAQDSETPKPAVLVAPVVNEKVAGKQVFIGKVEAIQQVDLRARVEGFLEKVEFKEGQMVEQGQLLYLIEQAQYKASLDQSVAEEEQAEATLEGAQAQAIDTQAEFDRQAQLLTRGNTSQARYDQAKAARDQAKASVSQAQAQIASAKADIEQAKLNLSYTEIHSPIGGKIGKTAVTAGNLVDPNTGVLATVVQLDPIRVVFSVSEAEYIEVTQRLLNENVAPDTKVFDFALTLPTGEAYPYQGSFSFVNNVVDQSTGTIALRANFQNPQQLLLPGQFVRVNTSEAEPKTFPVVPAKAVQQDQKGRFVFVLGKDDRAERRDITVGERVDQGWAVQSGLVSGEMVIVEGIQKLHNGIQVTPSPAKGTSAFGEGQSGGQGQTSGQGDSSSGEAGSAGQSGN